MTTQEDGVISQIFQIVREHGQAVNRGSTIGGMWTVDTWIMPQDKYYGLRVQLMDEGATIRIQFSGIDVSSTDGQPTRWVKGDLFGINFLLVELENDTEN